MHAVANSLPSGTEIDAILFDRTAARVLGEFPAPTRSQQRPRRDEAARLAAA
jgi:hypothetical protein